VFGRQGTHLGGFDGGVDGKPIDVIAKHVDHLGKAVAVGVGFHHGGQFRRGIHQPPKQRRVVAQRRRADFNPLRKRHRHREILQRNLTAAGEFSAKPAAERLDHSGISAQI
jgi:hypothetical protein